eukprot:6446293-Amphidinium_carterae.1
MSCYAMTREGGVLTPLLFRVSTSAEPMELTEPVHIRTNRKWRVGVARVLDTASVDWSQLRAGLI